jgi:DnaJ-domain-containing protein 1
VPRNIKELEERKAAKAASAQDQKKLTGPDTPLTKEEAYSILGLPANASADKVRVAHQRLMKKHHPDRGGSAEMAARINRARNLILGEGATAK